jgi:hypothetical protein
MKTDTTHTAEQTAELIRKKAEALLLDVSFMIDHTFPSDDFRKIIWIAIYENVKARINAYN